MLRALDYSDRPLIECTAESFEEAIGSRKPSTFNRIATLINAILHLAEEKKWVEKLPRITKKTVYESSFRFLTEEEWDALYRELPSHLKAPALFALKTGLRQANVLRLRWDKVDLRRRIAWVVPEEAKSKKHISLPLSDEAIAVLRSQIGKDAEWVFPYSGRGRKKERDGKKVTKPIGEIKNAFQEACHRAGVGVLKKWKTPDGKLHRSYSGFCWHDFRHTFASWHVMSGTPLEVLQKLGGWADIRMVLRYAHLDPGHIARYANNAKPWSRQEALAEEA